MDLSLKFGKAATELSSLYAIFHLSSLIRGPIFLPFHYKKAVSVSVLKLTN